jgi:hypothetical protein
MLIGAKIGFIVLLVIGCIVTILLSSNDQSTVNTTVSNQVSKLVCTVPNRSLYNILGEFITPGTVIKECEGIANNRYMMVLQTDGKIALYDGETMKWSTDDPGTKTGPYRAEYKTDGNFAIYSNDNTMIWDSGTAGVPSNKLAVTNGNSISMYNGNSTVWDSTYSKAGTTYSPNGVCTGFDRSPYRLLGDSITPETTIGQCQGLFNGRYMGVLQSDGKFVIYDLVSGPGNKLWETDSPGTNTGPYRAEYKTDGNFAIYSNDNTKIWDSDTQGTSSNSLSLSNSLIIRDGNLIKWTSAYPKAGTSYKPEGPCIDADRSKYRLLGDTILPGAIIGQCQGLFNGRYMGVQQSDGGFIIYDLASSNAIKWDSKTAGRGSPPYRAIYQTDGNFAIYSSDNEKLWDSDSQGMISNKLSIIDKELQIKNTYHTKWSSSYKKAGTTYTPNGTCTGFDRSPYRLLGESIKPGDTIEQCQGIFNGRYMGVQQSDGNFIVYDLLSGPGMVRWTSNTAGQGTGPYKATYQTDGNFKIYSKNGQQLYTSNTPSNNPTSFSLGLGVGDLIFK